MKMKLIGAALALTLSSGAAFACSDSIALERVAKVAGTYCPRLQLIEGAVCIDLAEAERFVAGQYNADPEGFCEWAWRRLGPMGSYKWQMLEAK